MRTKLVAFDLDGTLLDTLDDLTTSVNYALSVGGFPPRSKAEVCLFAGNGIGKLVERSLPRGLDETTVDNTLALFSAHYKEHCMDQTKPYKGVCALVEMLISAGVKVAVLSNKADFAVKKLVAEQFAGLPLLAYGERKGVPRKPDPTSLLQLLDETGVEKDEAVYVGDSDVDIRFAENVGVREIAVSWGFRSKTFLLEHGATEIADTTQELWKMLNE